MEASQRVVDFITKSNWLILIAGSLLALMANISNEFVLGIICGGCIIAINFHLLKTTLFNSFKPEVVFEKSKSLLGITLFKYYIRFAISGVIIYLII